MKQAASLKEFTPDTLLPGITVNTSLTDFAPIKQLQMMRFKGEKWELFGAVMSSEPGRDPENPELRNDHAARGGK
jgi:branched-chain amino acid transport system substrate-binding protein